MTVIDFRIRPPYKGFLGTAMYAQAERRDRITRSIGFEPSRAAQEKSVARVLGDFPALQVVSSHGNWPWVHQILHVAFRRPNLYLSPDYLLANMPGMDDYVKAADGWLAERVLYASAFPFAPIKDYLEWFRRLPIRQEHLEFITHKNAARLLKIPEETLAGGNNRRMVSQFSCANT